MPVTEFDLFKAGMADFRIDNLKISLHALKRCKERHIPLEDLRRRHNNVNGKAIIRNNTVVTAITNQMDHHGPKHEKWKKLEKRKEIQHKREEIKEKFKIYKKKEIAESKKYLIRPALIANEH